MEFLKGSIACRNRVTKFGDRCKLCIVRPPSLYIHICVSSLQPILNLPFAFPAQKALKSGSSLTHGLLNDQDIDLWMVSTEHEHERRDDQHQHQQTMTSSKRGDRDRDRNGYVNGYVNGWRGMIGGSGAGGGGVGAAGAGGGSSRRYGGQK